MKYTLYIGLNDKDTKRQEISTIEAYKLVAREACRLVDGATIFEATGYYRHEDGTIVIEQSLRCEVFTDDRKGEKLLMEFSFSLWGDNAKVWNLWVKKGWIERKKSLIHLSVQVDCPDGMACSRYNPQHTRDGKVDFNWMLDISDESLKALVEETVRRFMEAA